MYVHVLYMDHLRYGVSKAAACSCAGTHYTSYYLHIMADL